MKPEPGGEKGQTKEPTRRLQGNLQAISEVVELRMEKKADLMKSQAYRKCMRLWGKEPGTVS